MNNMRYTVNLSKAEVDDLRSIIHKGSYSAQTFRAAYILLNSDEGKYSDKVTNKQISRVLKVGMRTIDRVKKKFIFEGIASVLERRTSCRVYDSKAGGAFEEKLLSLYCSEPPEGSSKWTLRLLANKMVELNHVKSISHVTVGNVLKRSNFNKMKKAGKLETD